MRQSFLICLDNFIIKQMSLSKQNLQTQIEKLLNESYANQNAKIKVVRIILSKLQGYRQGSQYNKQKQEFNYQQMNTENQQIQLFNLQKSPIKRTDIYLQNSFERNIPYGQQNHSQTLTNMHRLSSQMKGFLFQSQQKKHGNRKIKKQKIIQLINKTNDCINTLCQGLHKTYSHLLASRMGRAVKFQVERIYLTHLKKILLQINQKLAQKMKTEDLIQFYCETLISLRDKIIKYEKKFILPQEQLNIPEPSLLFRVIVQ